MYDKCINCGKETKEPIDKPVELREYYVVGAGQLCENCYTEIYENDEK